MTTSWFQQPNIWRSQEDQPADGPALVLRRLGLLSTQEMEARAAAVASGGDLWYPLDPSPWRNLYLLGDASTGNASSTDPVGRVNAGQYGGATLPGPSFSGVQLNGSTDNGDGTYTIPSATNCRFLFSVAEFVQGATYEVTIQIVSGSGTTINSDLCDVNASSTTPVAGAVLRYQAQRATYDSTYRFVDVLMGTGSTATIVRPVLRQVPGNHLTQTTSSARPVAGVMGNGRGALTFDGTNDCLGTAAALFSAVSQPYTLICAYICTAAGGDIRECLGDSSRGIGFNLGKASILHAGSSRIDMSQSIVAGTPYVQSAVFQGNAGTLRGYLNGQIGFDNTAGNPATAAGSMFMGQRGQGSEFWIGSIAAAAVAPAALSDAQRKAIERYFAALIGASYAG